MRPATDFASVVFAGRILRRSLLLDFHRCFGHNNPSLFRKRSAHQGKQLAGLFVVVCGGYETNVHSANLIDLIVIDLREDQLLLNAHVVVATAIERVGVDASEVSYTGQSHVEQPGR